MTIVKDVQFHQHPALVRLVARFGQQRLYHMIDERRFILRDACAMSHHCCDTEESFYTFVISHKIEAHVRVPLVAQFERFLRNDENQA